MRAFEDFSVGEMIEHGARTLGAGEIAAFAHDYAPPPFSLGAPAAAEAGGPVASGWQVALTFMQLMASAMLLESTSMGSPGIETLHWLKPVRPGDTIRARSTVLAARVSQSRPGMGLVRFRHEALDAAGEIVLAMENSIMFGRAETAS